MKKVYAVFLIFIIHSPFLVRAADLCQPRTTLPSGTYLDIYDQLEGSAPSLTATLINDFNLNVSGSVLGVGNQAGEYLIPERIMVNAPALGRNMIANNRASFVINAIDNTEIIVQHNKESFIVPVKNGVPLSARGIEIQVSPPLAKPTRIFISSGSKVKINNEGRASLLKGESINWSGDSQNPLRVYLDKSVVLEETGPSDPLQRLTAITNSRGPNDSVIQVQTNISDYDFENNIVVFCFSASENTSTQGKLIRTKAKLIEQSGENAIFELKIPAKEETENFWQETGPLSGLFGNAATIQMIAYKNNDVFLKESIGITVTGFISAIIASLAVLGLILIISAIFMKTWNIYTITGSFVRGRSGKYSLSNFQIMIWTVLVVFALIFHWITTGQLLQVSEGILVLLGISGGTSTLVRGISSSRNNQNASSSKDKSASTLQDFVATQGKFDLLRFQMLAFTIFTWLYALINVLLNKGLPEIPESLYWLMGISNTTYIGSKIKGKNDVGSGVEDTSLSEFEKMLSVEDIKKLQHKLEINQSGILDVETRTAVKNYKRNQGIVPVDGDISKMLLDKLTL